MKATNKVMQYIFNTKNKEIIVRQANLSDDIKQIQKILNKYGKVTGFNRLDSIELAVKSGCSCVAIFKEEIVGASIASKRKRDGIVKSQAFAVLDEHRGVGIWRAMKSFQLQFGVVEWKTTVENESNKIFSKYCRLVRVEKGNKRALNVWQLISWEDKYAYSRRETV